MKEEGNCSKEARYKIYLIVIVLKLNFESVHATANNIFNQHLKRGSSIRLWCG